MTEIYPSNSASTTSCKILHAIDSRRQMHSARTAQLTPKMPSSRSAEYLATHNANCILQPECAQQHVFWVSSNTYGIAISLWLQRHQVPIGA